MIDITIGLDGKPDKTSIILGNQYENNDEVINFILPDDFNDYSKYVYGYYKGKRIVKRLLPVIDNQFKISSSITEYAGEWTLYLMCSETEIDLSADEVNIYVDSDKRLFISDPIIGVVNENYIDKKWVNELPLDSNLQIVYDELSEVAIKCKNILDAPSLYEEDYNAVIYDPATMTEEPEGYTDFSTFGIKYFGTWSQVESPFYSNKKAMCGNYAENEYGDAIGQSSLNTFGFKFEGTGCEALIRMNGDTGKIRINIYKQSSIDEWLSEDQTRIGFEIHRLTTEIEIVGGNFNLLYEPPIVDSMSTTDVGYSYGDLHRVPVTLVSGLEYGEYYVAVEILHVVDNSGTDSEHDRKEFYLDGIKILKN